MKATLPAILLAMALVPAAPGTGAACEGGEVFLALDEALPDQPDESIDVADVQSADGGLWEVYLAADGEGAAHLVRTDFGEGGRFSARLSVASPAAYAIATTRFIYSAPYYVKGATTIREEKDIFIFCDGKLLLPKEVGVDTEYSEKAQDARTIFDAGEIAGYVTALRR